MVIATQEKSHKIFISHASADQKYVKALVEMLEDIGMPEGSIVCTSVPGYGVPGGIDIFDWLRDQFLSCDIRVLYVFSKNYYASPSCLNEMGAAWVTKATDTLLLLPEYKFSDIKGCVNNRKIGISFESSEDELRHRLAQLAVRTTFQKYYFLQLVVRRHGLVPHSTLRVASHAQYEQT